MKSIFDESTRAEVIKRIDTLNENDKPGWGKMTVTQMMKHCALCEDYYLGNVKVKRSFIGRIFGKAAIKKILKDETSSFGKNAPTALQFRVSDAKLAFSDEQTNWIRLIKNYGTFDKNNFTHWFFGAISKEQLGQFIYKHCDHHLKQFRA